MLEIWDNENGEPSLAKSTKPDDTEKECPVWRGNLSPMWLAATGYILAFIVWMGLRQFGYKSAAFIVHTIFALAFVLACAWNLYHTPSHGVWYGNTHIWVGWTAMATGALVVTTGYVLVLTGQTTLSDTAKATFLGTGAFQLVVQVLMVYFMRVRRSIFFHMLGGSVVFYACALLPAINRMPQMFGFPDSDTWTFVSIAIGGVFVFFSVFYFSRKMALEANNNAEVTPKAENVQADVLEIQ